MSEHLVLFVKKKTEYEIKYVVVGSEMYIRDGLLMCIYCLLVCNDGQLLMCIDFLLVCNDGQLLMCIYCLLVCNDGQLLMRSDCLLVCNDGHVLLWI